MQPSTLYILNLPDAPGGRIWSMNTEEHPEGDTTSARGGRRICNPLRRARLSSDPLTLRIREPAR
jgi:hypothetical protein